MRIHGIDYSNGAQGALIQFAADNGWVLDPTATTDYGKSQNKWVWIKDAAHGGKWRIEFDYRVRDSWRSTDDRLRGIDVCYIPAGAKIVKIEDGYDDEYVRTQWTQVERLHKALGWNGNTLRPVTRWNKSVLFDVSNPAPESDKVPTLRKRAETLLANPDLVIWLAAERVHNDEIAREKRWEEEREDNALRARPLPLKDGISQKSYEDGSCFWKMQWRLKNAAHVICAADGKTDLYAAVEEAQAALDAIKDALLPKHMGAYVLAAEEYAAAQTV